MPIIKEFGPDLILVSSGFDSARGDMLGGLDVLPKAYAYMT
jgi:acetoin utilization deacetylase AcuC-like enzyme